MLLLLALLPAPYRDGKSCNRCLTPSLMLSGIASSLLDLTYRRDLEMYCLKVELDSSLSKGEDRLSSW
jgi:hypothetical protein